jgi:hypothetical protein
MHKGAYDFQRKQDETLAAKAERAVNTIYSAGLMFRGGALGPGGNCVMAGNAAKAFSADELATLRGNGTPQGELLAGIIEAYQEYDALDYRTSGIKGDTLLHKTYDLAQALKVKGWTPQSEPHRISFMTGPRP